MDTIETLTAELAEALTASDEMARMREAEARVGGDPAASALLRTYLEAQGAYAAHPTADGAGALTAALEAARSRPEIATLMAAQQALLTRVQTAQNTLWRAIGIEPDTGCDATREMARDADCDPPASGTPPPTGV